MAELIFYVLALGVCITAILTVTARHIFHSAVYLSMCLLSIAGLYFYLDAAFIGVIQVLVYIGGIITLFIFAIKLTANMDDLSIPQVNKQVIPSAIISLTLFAIMLYSIGSVGWAFYYQAGSLSLPDLGRALMTRYVLPFEFISLVLLSVMVGAIVIGRVKK